MVYTERVYGVYGKGVWCIRKECMVYTERVYGVYGKPISSLTLV